MKNEISKPKSYILRLWVEKIDDKEVWRFSLENVFTGKRKGFSRIEELIAYLQSHLKERGIG